VTPSPLRVGVHLLCCQWTTNMEQITCSTWFTCSSTNLVLVAVMSCASVRRHCDCSIASLAPFINIQTYLLTYFFRCAERRQPASADERTRRGVHRRADLLPAGVRGHPPVQGRRGSHRFFGQAAAQQHVPARRLDVARESRKLIGCSYHRYPLHVKDRWKKEKI